MNEQELQEIREKLENLLRGSVSDRAWNILLKHHLDQVEAVWRHRNSNEDWEDLRRVFEPIREADRGGGAGRRAIEKSVAGQLRSHEIARAEVFSEYVSRMAAINSRVRRFRERVLGGRTLGAEEARALLRSPFASFKVEEWFRVKGVSITDHQCRIAGGEEDEQGPYSWVETFSEAGGQLWLKDKRPLDTGPWVMPDTNPTRKRELGERKRELKHKTARYRILLFPGEEGEAHSTLVKRVSVLGQAEEIAQALLKSYPWLEQDAAWFLLTGETPFVAPITFRGKYSGLNAGLPDGYGYGFVTLTIEPWVSADTVREVYTEIQQQWARRNKNNRPENNRPVGEKNCRLLSFVTKRALKKVGSLSLSPAARRRLGKSLVAEWNCENPQWAYRGTTPTQDFWRDYNASWRQIASPDYNLS